MYVIRTILTYLWIFVLMFLVSPYRWYCEKVTKEDANRGYALIHKADKWFCKGILKIIGIKLVVSGTENIPNDENVLFVGNHQSMLDIAALLAVVDRPVGFLAKAQLSKVRIFRKWILSIGSVFIERGETRKGLEAIINCAKQVKEGQAMMVYPEGTRTRDGSLGEFKAGSMKIASKGNACIVPVAIDGAYLAMPSDKIWMYAKEIKLTFLPKISQEEVKASDSNTLAIVVKEKINSVL